MRRLLLIAAQTFTTLFLLVVYAQPREPQTTSADVYAAGPISAVGHGAMLDHKGNRIEPTPEFIADAQRYYLDNLFKTASKEQQARIGVQEYLPRSWIVWVPPQSG